MRFTTDQALFDAFPSARDHIKTEPAGGSPLTFLKRLSDAGKIGEGLAFCAYMLPRRDAVAWACQCLAAKWREDGAVTENAPLVAARSWVEAPSEEKRIAAYACWNRGDREDPASWIALGAAWSGGSLSPDLPNSLPAPPHLTANVIRVALLLLLHKVPRGQQTALGRDWIAAGAHQAKSGL